MVVVLKQRFEFRTMGAHGTSFVTHHAQAYADVARSRARRCLPACRREGHFILTASSEAAKQDKMEDIIPLLYNNQNNMLAIWKGM